MSESNGFTRQTCFSGACGKYAMQHALLLLGIPIKQKDVNNATGRSRIYTMLFGTDEKRLKMGLKYFGCDTSEHNYRSPSKLRDKLDELLLHRYPVILSVKHDYHWIVIAGNHSRKKYLLIDSNNNTLFGCWNWNDIVVYINNQEYYLIGVKPKNEKQLCHSLVPNFSKIYSLLADNDLRQYWGYYLEDLNKMFDAHEGGNNILTATKFFDQFGKIIYDASSHYYHYADSNKIKEELDNYRKVAIAHNLLISKDKIPSTIANLSAALID